MTITQRFAWLLKKSGLLSVGLFLKYLLDWPFDYILYPIVLCTFGWLEGGVIMTLLSIPINFMQIYLYDKAGIDFFSFEAAKQFVESPEKQSWLTRTMQKSKIVAFFVLSWQDPFFVPIYFRKGSHQYNGLNKTGWFIFLGATLVANGIWITFVALGLESVELLGEGLRSTLNSIGLGFIVSLTESCR